MIGPFQVYFWKLKLFEFWDSYLSRKIPGSSLKINPSWGGVSSNSMSPSVCGGAFITVGADVGFGLKSCHALYLFEWALYDFEISTFVLPRSEIHFWTSPEVKCIHLRASSSSIHFSFELTSESNHWKVVGYSEVLVSQGLTENVRKSHFLNSFERFNQVSLVEHFLI